MAKVTITLEDADTEAGTYTSSLDISGADIAMGGLTMITAAQLAGAYFMMSFLKDPDFQANILQFAINAMSGDPTARVVPPDHANEEIDAPLSA